MEMHNIFMIISLLLTNSSMIIYSRSISHRFQKSTLILPSRCNWKLKLAERSVYTENHRFWTNNYSIDLSKEKIDNSINISCLVDIIAEKVNSKKIILPNSEMGVIIADITSYHSSHSSQLIIPIHQGITQPQHSIVLNSSMKAIINTQLNDTKLINMLICGFSPRASHVVTPPNEEERPIDEKRLEALNTALLTTTSTTAEELLSVSLAGTPPARIYRSFISPRAKANYLVEPVERAANRS